MLYWIKILHKIISFRTKISITTTECQYWFWNSCNPIYCLSKDIQLFKWAIQQFQTQNKITFFLSSKIIIFQVSAKIVQSQKLFELLTRDENHRLLRTFTVMSHERQWRLKSLANWLFGQQLFRSNIKESMRITGPLWGKSSGNQRIPLIQIQ